MDKKTVAYFLAITMSANLGLQFVQPCVALANKYDVRAEKGADGNIIYTQRAKTGMKKFHVSSPEQTYKAEKYFDIARAKLAAEDYAGAIDMVLCQDLVHIKMKNSQTC